MKLILKKYLITTLSIFILMQIVSAISYGADIRNLFKASAVMTVLFYLGRPIANLIMLPINILTLNLSSWLLNILLFYLWTVLDKNIAISLWQFNGISSGFIHLDPVNFFPWQVVIIGGILLTLIIKFMDWLVH